MRLGRIASLIARTDPVDAVVLIVLFCRRHVDLDDLGGPPPLRFPPARRLRRRRPLDGRKHRVERPDGRVAHADLVLGVVLGRERLWDDRRALRAVPHLRIHQGMELRRGGRPSLVRQLVFAREVVARLRLTGRLSSLALVADKVAERALRALPKIADGRGESAGVRSSRLPRAGRTSMAKSRDSLAPARTCSTARQISSTTSSSCRK